MKATNKLRWLVKSNLIMESDSDGSLICTGTKEEQVLQQMHVLDDGSEEWKDIEIVFEEDINHEEI